MSHHSFISSSGDLPFKLLVGFLRYQSLLAPWVGENKGRGNRSQIYVRPASNCPIISKLRSARRFRQGLSAFDTWSNFSTRCSIQGQDSHLKDQEMRTTLCFVWYSLIASVQ